MATPDQETLDRLERRRDGAVNTARQLLETRQAAGIRELDDADATKFRGMTETIRELDEHIDLYRGELQRARIPDRFARLGGGGSGNDAEQRGRQWARDTAEQLRRVGGEQRAVVSGSLDVPSLLDLPVVAIPFPKRLIDVLGNRLQLDSPGLAFEYYRQSPPRTNAAAPVPDLGTKSTSALTVTAETDRCRVIAHLSDYLPIRIFWNFGTVTSWLYDQMFQCVLDAIEQQVISGDGTGENMTGILNTSGTTDVAFNTDVPTTLRSAVSALQSLGETPTGWCLNPADAEAIDLTRWGTTGGFLSGGYEHDTGVGFGTSSNIFGSDDIARVVTPHVPAGTALLADWSQLLLVFQQYMRLDSDTYSGFDQNAIRFRAESFVGIGILRPQAFAVVTLA